MLSKLAVEVLLLIIEAFRIEKKIIAGHKAIGFSVVIR